MRLQFLGTRGGITARSKYHFYHSSLLISFRKTSILIDWGEDWYSKRLPKNLDGILTTHAHPDHMGGISNKIKVPIYATQDSWDIFSQPHAQAQIITPREPFSIGPFEIEPFAVQHSIRAPAVGYKIHAGKRALFYASDLNQIIDKKDALSHLDLYIGDGAIITRTLLKRIKEGVPTGHSPIIEQLSWCKKYHVPKAVFTHCGTEITTGNHSDMLKQIQSLGKEFGVSTRLAYDGMSYTV